MSKLENAAPTALRPLGRTGLRVTGMGFGGAPIGGFRGAVSEDDSRASIRAALDHGLTLYDTSPFYGYGRSELRVGQALRDLPRDSFVLSTKVGRVMEPYPPSGPPEGLRPGGLPFAPRFDYSARGAERSIEQSMMRLGIPEFDILYIHDVDVFTHKSQAEADRRYDEAVSGCLPYLLELRRRGVIKAVGVGLNEVAMSLRFARETDIDCILLAGRYTLLDQEAVDELFPVCLEKGIGVVLGAPFSSGVLATGLTEAARYNYGAVPAEIADRVRRLETISARHGVGLKAAALQFPLGHPAIASVIPGAVSAREVEDNVASMAETIPAAFWDELVADGLLRSDASLPGSAA